MNGAGKRPVNVVVLGGYGSVGAGIVKNLARLGEVEELCVAGRSEEKGRTLAESFARDGMSFRRVDLDDACDLSAALRGFDIVVNATYAEYNLAVMQAALRGGCHYLDLGGMFHITRRQLELHRQFSEAGLTAVLCMGACPGMSNVFAARGAGKLDRVEEIHIRVGSRRGADFQGFNMAPRTLIAEFTRNPFVYENGDWNELEPLSGREKYRLPEPVGEVEGFYCIHSEVLTLPMSFDTVRRVTYQVSFPPAIMNMMDVLRSLKLLSSEGFPVKGVEVSPRDYLEAYLGATIKTASGYLQEHKALQVDVRGIRDGQAMTWRCETVVGSNRELDLLSSAYWTSVPHSIVVAMLSRGDILQRGVFPPERIVDSSLLFEELERRGIRVSESEVAVS